MVFKRSNERCIIMENIRYDIDNIIVGDEEVEICQYLRPDGRKRRIAAPLGKEYKEKVKDLIISAEVLPTGLIAVYLRHKDQDEEEEKIDLLKNDDTINDEMKKFIDKFLAGLKK